MSQVHTPVFKTSDLCDACDAAQVVPMAFRSFGRRAAFSGTARTVRYAAGIAVLRDILHDAGEDQVLVIDGGGLRWRALFGDRMAELAIRNRWAGIVVHGDVRDAEELDAMDIGVKALGTAPRRADIGQAGESGVTVLLGDVAVAPGQRIVADRDGIVVLPLGLHESTIDTRSALAATSHYVSASR